MGKTLTQIAQELKDSNKKVQLIYAFNGTGKTRLSREFKDLVSQKNEEVEEIELENKNILYYNAFTEDLFYWDNDLEHDKDRKLLIRPNAFTKWVFEDQGQDQNVITNFQHYTNEKLTPHFNAKYTTKNDDGKEVTIPAFSEVTFTYERGHENDSEPIKISKGEESCFVWSVFFSLLEQVVSVLNVPDETERETNQFDKLEYVFIDDPVSSLDENHLIEIAVNLSQVIKHSSSELKFIITTHNPLFFNVIHNEFKGNKANKFFLKRDENGEYELSEQRSDSPFSYHLFLKSELEKAIEDGKLKKYHFNFFRNILEKTSTFLGYETWGELLPQTSNGQSNPYENRIINISSHSKHSGNEIIELTDNDTRMLKYLLEELKKNHAFK